MQDVEGKVAFITGGASGIGLGAAKAFVDAGMKVVMADVRQDHIDEALSFFESKQQARQVHGIRLDVTDREAFAAAADETVSHFGKVHVLFSNAGMGVGGPIKGATFNDWDWGLGVMIGGVVNGLTLFLPHILKHGEGGHILTTSSMSALIPIPGATIYTTCKAAVVGMMESIRAELAPDNIGVSAFCPGPVQSNIHESARTRPEKYRNDGSEYAERERQLGQRPVNPLWMDNYECGQRILNGIRRNDLYILTHPEFEPGAREHYEAILSSFPHEKPNLERAKAIGFLLGNQIFPDTIRQNRENPV
jgi:NAD(P)-dependent dehydrogenase (short-subunit alcohol dehydrogenase family)